MMQLQDPTPTGDEAFMQALVVSLIPYCSQENSELFFLDEAERCMNSGWALCQCNTHMAGVP
jgi:hypothetical protein